MASSKDIVFFIYDSNTGAPLAGQTANLSFATYSDTSGGALTNPAITEIGGGAYKFTITFPISGLGVVYVLACSSVNATPSYQHGFVRPEEFYIDNIATLMSINQGRWKIHTSGPDANRLVYYADDGITVLKKFDLFDADGNPTTSTPFERVPV